jgi:peptide/nickel transport system substrate-binding protein
VTRARSSLRVVLRALAASALLALLLTGCGGSSASRARHTFIDEVPGLPADLDETGTPDIAQMQIMPSWSSELVRPRGVTPGPHAVLPSADSVVPYLATSWKASPNGDYTFQLRHGVRGSTGNPFTAADVKWSIERELATSPVIPFLFTLANVDQRNPVTVVGPFAVRINVTAPSPLLLGVLSLYDAGIYDRRAYLAHATAADPWAEQWGSTHSATFGAYSVQSFTPGTSIVLNANPGSWVHPYYTTVDINVVSNPNDRLADLIHGTADHTSGLEWSNFTYAQQYGSQNHLSATILQTGPQIESWLLSVHKGALADPRVRKAISAAVNRNELSEVLYAGFAAPDVLATPAIYGQRQPPGLNLPLARRLLSHAGYPHGLTIDVDVPLDIAGGSEATELTTLTAQLAQAGITLVPTVVSDSDQLLALARAHQVASTIEDISPLLSGTGFLLLQNDSSTLDSVSPAAEQGYANPALNALLTRIRDTPDGTRYDRLVAEASRLIDADAPTVNLFEVPVQNVTRDGITGYAAYANPVTYYEDLHPTR